MSFEDMLIEVCDVKRTQDIVSTPTGRQKRHFATVATDVPCLFQAFGGSKSGKSGGSGGSTWEDRGFLPIYEWRFFAEPDQDIREGDRLVSATRGKTYEVYSESNVVTPGYETGHHLELRVREMAHEGA